MTGWRWQARSVGPRRTPAVRSLGTALATLMLSACAGASSPAPSLTAPQASPTPTATRAPTPEIPAAPTPTDLPTSPLSVGASVTTVVDELEAATGGLTLGPDGALYVADIGKVPARDGDTVYRVSLEGEVSVYAQGEALNGASGNAFDSLGNLYQANYSGSDIARVSPSGEFGSIVNPRISGPVGIAVDHQDNLYVANCAGRSIAQVSPDGQVSLIAQGSPLNCPNGITLGDDGTIYVANFGDGWVLRVDADGDVSRLAELPGHNNGHLVFYDGLLFVTARGAHQVFTVSTDGEVALLAGSGRRGWEDGGALEASFSLPNGIAISADGRVLYLNQVRLDSGGLNYPSSIRAILLPDR